MPQTMLPGIRLLVVLLPGLPEEAVAVEAEAPESSTKAVPATRKVNGSMHFILRQD